MVKFQKNIYKSFTTLNFKISKLKTMNLKNHTKPITFKPNIQYNTPQTFQLILNIFNKISINENSKL